MIPIILYLNLELYSPFIVNCIKEGQLKISLLYAFIYLVDRKCGDNEFQCSNSSLCIPATFMCDTQNDCADGSDETQQLCSELSYLTSHIVEVNLSALVIVINVWNAAVTV